MEANIGSKHVTLPQQKTDNRPQERANIGHSPLTTRKERHMEPAKEEEDQSRASTSNSTRSKQPKEGSLREEASRVEQTLATLLMDTSKRRGAPL